MPRIHQKADVYCNDGFRREVLSQLKYMGLLQHDLAEHLNLSDATISIMLRQPEKIPVERLRKIIAFLDLEPATVLRFVGFSERVIKSEYSLSRSRPCR